MEHSSNSPESEVQLEVTVRSGGLEIRARGSVKVLSKELSSIVKFAKLAQSQLLGEKFSAPSETAAPEEESESPPPAIKVGKSTISNLQVLFDTSWGKTPKSVEQIATALEYNAVPDSLQSIGRDLYRLVKRGVLRRVRNTGLRLQDTEVEKPVARNRFCGGVQRQSDREQHIITSEFFTGWNHSVQRQERRRQGRRCC